MRRRPQVHQRLLVDLRRLSVLHLPRGLIWLVDRRVAPIDIHVVPDDEHGLSHEPAADDSSHRLELLVRTDLLALEHAGLCARELAPPGQEPFVPRSRGEVVAVVAAAVNGPDLVVGTVHDRVHGARGGDVDVMLAVPV